MFLQEGQGLEGFMMDSVGVYCLFYFNYYVVCCGWDVDVKMLFVL